MKLFQQLCLCGLLSSCINTSEKVEQSKKQITASYLNELNKQVSNTPSASYKANWKKAKADLLLQSPKLHLTYFQIDDSLERRMQVWKNMIPSLYVSLSNSSSLSELSDLFVNTSFRVSSFFNIGNIIDLPANVAENRLRHMGAELIAEQAMRNEIIALYRVFREQELLDIEAQALQWERQYIEDTAEDKNNIQFDLAIETMDEKDQAFALKVKEWRLKVSDTMQIRYSVVRFDLTDLPNIHYSGKSLDFSNSKQWGNLQMNLLALELIAEESKILSAYKRYLPDPNLGVSAPPLYSSNSTQNFAVEDFRINPSLTWRLDTRGAIAKQLNRIKREAPNRKWTRDRRMQTEIEKLLEGKKTLIKVQQKLKEHRILVKEYKELVKDGLLQDLDTIIAQMSKFKQQEIDLRSLEVDICTSLWLIDESRWTQTTKEWKRSRLKFNAIQKKKKKGSHFRWLKKHNPFKTSEKK